MGDPSQAGCVSGGSGQQGMPVGVSRTEPCSDVSKIVGMDMDGEACFKLSGQNEGKRQSGKLKAVGD